MASSNGANARSKATEIIKEQIKSSAENQPVKELKEKMAGKRPALESAAPELQPKQKKGAEMKAAVTQKTRSAKQPAKSTKETGPTGKRKQAKDSDVEPSEQQAADAAKCAPAKRQKAAEKEPGIKKASEAEDKTIETKKTNKKPKGHATKKAAEPSKHESSEDDSETKQREEAPRQELKTSRGRMTQNVNYSEGPDKDPSGRAVAVKEEEKADSEADAIKQLSAGGKTFRLLDFLVADEASERQPLDRVEHQKSPLWVSGAIYPPTGLLGKEAGRRVERFGPVLSWQIVEQNAAVQIVLKTPAAEYTCIRAAAGYKGMFAHLMEQSEVAFEVQKALNPSAGGSTSATLEEVTARLSRAKVGKGYFSAKEALLLNGNFVISYLKSYDRRAGSGSSLGETLFTASLQEEVTAMQNGGGAKNGAIVINEPSAAPETGMAPALGSAEKRSMQADADYARQLQAKMDVQEARATNKRGGAKGVPYIKISEAEIADDYPEPAQYEKYTEEMDELLLADDELFDVDPEYLPRRLLKDFSVYNSEGMMSTLELLPMWGGAQPDVELFASGAVVDDDGEWAGGQSLQVTDEGGSGAGGSSGAAGGSGAAPSDATMRIFSSQIQEWIVEFSCDMLFISIRTDAAWYRLTEPAPKYAPWFSVVLKSARVAVKTLTLLSEEKRASKLSFNDVIKRLTAADEADTTFISKKVASVERFVVVHGQILLNQFQHFPVKAVKNSAFASTLKARMELRRHAKLYFKAAKVVKTRSGNRNPMRDRASVKDKPMTATATSLVRSIWQSYFPTTSAPSEGGVELAAEAAAVAAAQPAAVEVEEDLNEEDDEGAEENALAEAEQETAADEEAAVDTTVVWEGKPLREEAGKSFYRAAKVGESSYAIGDVVSLGGLQETLLHPLGLVQALWQAKKGEPQMQIRSVLRGAETVLGDAASQDELFVTTKIFTRSAKTAAGVVKAARLDRRWRLEDRRAHMQADSERRERNAQAAKDSQPLEYVYRSLYVPEEGKFCELPADFRLGTIAPEPKDGKEEGISLTADGNGLLKDGQEYRKGDFVFLRPNTLDQLEEANTAAEPAEYASKGRFHKGGANAGLLPYGIAQLLSIARDAARGKCARKSAVPTKVEVRRFYRPEDISPDLAHSSDFWDVFASDEQLEVDVTDIVSKTRVAVGHAEGEDTFVCRKTFKRADGSFTDPPVDLTLLQKAARGKGKAVDKGKGIKGEEAAPAPASRKSTAVVDGVSLASMDIFAGCGGLTEGLHQAGAAHAKWAIEYEEPAAEAFRMNHPDANCWAKNCNVILTAAMLKAGMSDLCTGSSEAEEQAKGLDPETLASLPLPGEVEFLCGGPPCQGYSGMNRFNKGNWSMVQNSMVMAYLSFADFYRPRYFLLENVRNFVSHNKSFTFRLTLRSLLDMGYQVRFGVLNAGNFGVSQSRKRTFIWAAAPGELLPDWPKLLHIFRSPQLTINLPGDVKYSAVPQTEGAPLRTVTVKDVISDLPPISNGHAVTEIEYGGPPVSAFQKKVRGEETVLRDHISKEMNPLNLERCRCIPKNQPGADWRVLQQIADEDPARAKFQGQDLVPWCLPNTAERHNGWRGLFGRLDWAGHFPTSTTDPQPMGKVGQVFHPVQDRIVSVRECARAQGFPDSFRFYGNVHSKHRQIGNAVPPPLAFSLGKCLRKALEKTAAARQAAILAAQMGGQ